MIALRKEDKIIGIICIAAAFSYQFAMSIMAIFRVNDNYVSLLFRLINITVFAVALFIFPKRRSYRKKEVLLFLCLLFVPLFEVLTGLFYGAANSAANTYLLGFIVACIPAALMGVVFSVKCNYYWQTAIQILSGIISIACLHYLVYKIITDPSRELVYGFDYQSISYLGAYGFINSIYIGLYYDHKLNTINIVYYYLPVYAGNKRFISK